ncbi:hypothetical protein RFI_25862 [Reticulomyxa filosa]|uniref:Uncharacterized protein n=1 Tax=Reticulomyxa filosa TaxID=46433 RepID=X6MCC6_RETFI|nr:hypothetical protein RFI_25862 [Reticulomyxa filosa]|eukprot:ETO11514.1 hypothetical protein RFI_25862 [Reticulomyxa filosa]
MYIYFLYFIKKKKLDWEKYIIRKKKYRKKKKKVYIKIKKKDKRKKGKKLKRKKKKRTKIIKKLIKILIFLIMFYLGAMTPKRMLVKYFFLCVCLKKIISKFTIKVGVCYHRNININVPGKTSNNATHSTQLDVISSKCILSSGLRYGRNIMIMTQSTVSQFFFTSVRLIQLLFHGLSIFRRRQHMEYTYCDPISSRLSFC